MFEHLGSFQYFAMTNNAGINNCLLNFSLLTLRLFFVCLLLVFALFSLKYFYVKLKNNYLSASTFTGWLFSHQQVDLDVTLPGEGGKDRPFKVSIKFVSRVSWHLLHEVLTGRTLPEPLELDKPISTNPVHAVDVVLRHLPSMKWVLLAFFLFRFWEWRLSSQELCRPLFVYLHQMLYILIISVEEYYAYKFINRS